MQAPLIAIDSPILRFFESLTFTSIDKVSPFFEVFVTVPSSVIIPVNIVFSYVWIILPFFLLVKFYNFYFIDVF